MVGVFNRVAHYQPTPVVSLPYLRSTSMAAHVRSADRNAPTYPNHADGRGISSRFRPPSR